MEIGGETGIRTLDTVSRIHAFQACAFNHSATSPSRQGAKPAGSKTRTILTAVRTSSRCARNIIRFQHVRFHCAAGRVSLLKEEG